ncbi:MAG: hypothetical protein QOJ55_1175 [Solirubrobacteraceae bacterium]|jgi:hypothetical protein|nr:hypothetical protein [Solirubrobacteraceae bacterium]MDX6673315.1 hypothetical protein [Solirubrobacteraceae bacterium]
MRSRIACALIVIGLAAAAAGCGSSSSAKSATTTAPGARGGQGGGRFQALAKCMASKGIKLPNRRQQPGSGGPPPGLNLSDPKLRQALLDCRTQVFGNSAPGGPPGGPPGGAPGGVPPGQGGGTVQ